MTPLHLAAGFGSSTEVVNTLIRAGAHVDALDSLQRSPLHWASWWNPALVPVLIGAKCEVNLLNVCQPQESPLYYAARYSMYWGSARSARSAVLALVRAGADPDLGRSPLTCSFVCDGVKTLIKSNIPLV